MTILSTVFEFGLVSLNLQWKRLEKLCRKVDLSSSVFEDKLGLNFLQSFLKVYIVERLKIFSGDV